MTPVAALWLALAAPAAADDPAPTKGPSTVQEALRLAKARRDSVLCWEPIVGDAGEQLLQLYDRSEDPRRLLVSGVGPTLVVALSKLPQYGAPDPLTVPPCQDDEPEVTP